MCQYSASPDPPNWGRLTPYHIATLCHCVIKGASLVFIEATSVTPNGRISPNDSGLWEDGQILGVRQVADIIHAAGGKVGIQLAHAGLKASTVAPWLGREKGQSVIADTDVGGWPQDVVGPSALAWSQQCSCQPQEMTLDEIHAATEAFAQAAQRAVQAGVDVIEIHGAHGYLLSSFNSPISNRRTDKYGGSFENRIRLSVEVIQAVRSAIPANLPLFYRLTSTEWMEHSEEAQSYGSWDVQQSIRFSKLLSALGVDLLDVSSGGNHQNQQIPEEVDYQVAIAGTIRHALKLNRSPLLVGAVGLITEAEAARDIVQRHEAHHVGGGFSAEAAEAESLVHGDGALADAVLVARQFMREPEWVLQVAWELGVEVQWPIQFGRGRFRRRRAI